MLRMRPALQLGIGHLIAEGAKCRGLIDPHQEIRPASPGARQEGPLKDDLGTLHQRCTGRLRIDDQIATGNLQHGFPVGLQLLQMRRLMRVALFLQKGRVLAVFSRLWPLAAQSHQVERRCMRAAHEPHQVGRGEKVISVNMPHGRLPLDDHVRTCRANKLLAQPGLGQRWSDSGTRPIANTAQLAILLLFRWASHSM